MNSRRKGRGGASTRDQRPRSVAPEGVYNNVPFMHSATLQLGNIARLRTISGEVWEGVFRTFSPEFEAVLEAVVKLENPDTPDERPLADTQKESLIFKMLDVLTISFRDVDMDYATKDSFQTDSAISSRVNGSRSEEKELEPWDAGNMNGNDVNLELEMSNGWDVQDMFRKNEQEYGVQSTFDHSLRGYTVPLQTSDTADFREAQAKAAQIAQEIENQPAYKARLDMENGDEEAAFAAVVRPAQDSDKYIPPAKRKETNNGKLVVRSPPPATSSGGTQNLASPKDTRPPPVSYPAPPHVHQSTTHVIQNSLPPPHMPPIQHVMPPQHLPNTMMPPPPMTNVPPPGHSQPMAPMAQQHVPIPPNHANTRANSHTPPQYQQGPPPRHGMHHSNGPPNHKGQPNGDLMLKTNRTHRQQQNYAQAPDRGQAMPPGHPQGPPPQQDCGLHSVPQAMRQPPPVAGVQNQEAMKELHLFAKEFNLVPMAHSSPAGSSVPPHLAVQHGGQMPPPDAAQMGPPAQALSAGTSANSANVTNAPSSGADQSQATGGSQTQPTPAQSPPSDSDKLQTAVSKSKLNPNAKEFVLSPMPKPFQPRSPSTPSVSRPHTPQTPSHNPYMTAAVNGPGGPSMPVAVLPMPYMTISQPQYQAPPPQANRMRKMNMRAEVSHMPHAAAVTGQPLLAPAPIHQYIYNPQAAVHGMNQAAYQPAAVASLQAAALGRMYDAGAVATTTQRYFQIPYLPPQPNGAPSGGQGTYNPAGVQQQGPPQGSINYQHYLQAVPQQQPPPQMPTMFCIPTQPHMLPNVPYMQQGPPPGAPHPHVQLLLQHQHPSQGGNPHGPSQ
uniref:LsmAD domain-containing protein n=1 Tax=Dendroctonus ponderosae TaxID=77166 RepID=A0AAR5PS49_DENPD